MKKHYYFFVVPVSPVVSFWSISGVELPSDGSDNKEPIPLPSDKVVDFTGALIDERCQVPILPYDHVGAAFLSLSRLNCDILDVRPFQNGGFSIHFEMICDDVE